MIYDLDIPAIIRRYVPVWFRKSRNLAFAAAAASWCRSMQQRFISWRETEIMAEYRYNGLLHSLEWMMNDRFDAVPRRIYITVTPQVPVAYHINESEPSVVSYVGEGQMSGYYHLDETDVTELYRHEFVVHVPVALASIAPKRMFDRLDIYRFAGRRPAIRYFDTSDNTVSMVYYNALSPAFNQP